jgi:hypothetical protein
MSKILDLNIEETATHKRAFLLYSTLDPVLSSSEREQTVASRLGGDVDGTDIKNWSNSFHWEERLAQDAQIVQKGLDSRTRKEKLRGQVEILVDKIAGLLCDDKSFTNITIDDGKTISQLAGALDKLVHTVCVLDGSSVDTVIVRSDKPMSDLTDEELAEAVKVGRARAAARTDDGPEAA